MGDSSEENSEASGTELAIVEQPTAVVEEQESKGKPGRPLKEITDEVIQKAEALAARQNSRAQIAHFLGMGESTLYEKMNRFPELSEAIDRGAAAGIASITEAIFRKAKAGDVQAQKFILERKGGWKQAVDVGLSGGVTIIIAEGDESI